MMEAKAWSVVALLSLAGSAAAQGPAGEPQDAPAAVANDASTSEPETPAVGSAISVQINLDYTTAYFYRGIIQEDSGLILQPAARLTANLHDSEELRLDAFAGLWNSFHGQKTAASTDNDFVEYWYEADVYGGLTATSGKVSFTASYAFLTSPSDAFDTVQELGFTVALDDSAWLDAWALKPYATIAIETGSNASDGADSDTGVYLELGIGPGLVVDVGSTPVTLTFPAQIGLSLSDYYQDSAGNDDTFGFAQVGARASLPLGEPGRFGAWTLNGGVSLLFLGDNTKAFNSDDETEVIGTLGLQWNF